jgi:hypothetical protein
VHDLENRPMATMSPRRSHRVRVAMAVAIAMLMAGCDSSPEAHRTELNSKVDAGTKAPSPPPLSRPPLLYFRGDTVTHNWVEVAIYADGRVIRAIGDGDPGYLQIRLTPEAVERLRSRAVSTGLFEQDQGLTLDHRPGSMEVRLGSMEVRRHDRSVIVVWGKDPSATRSWAKAIVSRDLERTSAATAKQKNEVSQLVAFFRDPTAWRLSSSFYMQPETSPFVPSRILVVYDRGEPDWSTVPSPAREIVSKRLGGLSRGGPNRCQVISTDQARKIARALTQAGINAHYDSQRGLLDIRTASSFVHSKPALPHEVAC